MTPGIWQILVVVLLVMVLFGAGRIPTIMENLAKGINSFKKGLKDEDKASGASKNSDKTPMSEDEQSSNGSKDA